MENESSIRMTDWSAKIRSSELATSQSEMFPLELTGILPDCPRGAHLEFIGEIGSNRYYCKRDKNGRPIRATEWFCNALARLLEIPTPDYAPVLNPENGEILFGSRGQWGTVDGFEVETFLTTPQIADKAAGGTGGWLHSYLAGLYVFDLFVGNPDRHLSNFLLVPEGGMKKLVAFDFASAELHNLSDQNFNIAQTPTLLVGRRMRSLHGFDTRKAHDMLERIETVQFSAIDGILTALPDDWLNEVDKGKIHDQWKQGRIKARTAALRRGLNDDSLL